MSTISTPPLALYVHMPWCVQKCPYCDFNSHKAPTQLPQQAYIDALCRDLCHDATRVGSRELQSIFIGGGTPSLFQAEQIARLLEKIKQTLAVKADIEITLEANPGTVDYLQFKDFKDAGINRLSIGIQSLNDQQLKRLGRIHDKKQALKAIETAKKIDFNSFNVDIMYGLPEQSIKEAIADLEMILSLNPPHVSWYQLTLEPNTFFYRYPPKLPKDDALFEIEQLGHSLLNKAGLNRYEISAFGKENHACKHNINYWQFGDYMGIGAGAHGKITDTNPFKINRMRKRRMPDAYLSKQPAIVENKEIQKKEQIFEFMLNALRLINGFHIAQFEQRTACAFADIEKEITQAIDDELLIQENNVIKPSRKGLLFLNELIMRFMK